MAVDAMTSTANADGPDQSLNFDVAVDAALSAGRTEIEKLQTLSDEALAEYQRLVEKAQSMSSIQHELTAQFEAMSRDFAEKASGHLRHQREVLSTFNIAFFGRTGAGKSTLLSTFGRLDGGGVSPGESDWTTDVQTVTWRGCCLYDTPGINGWGGRQSRDELEATARKAVEVADVVLLCFDSQSQQASEFTKVAEWVCHFGKPTIAVLNVRNLRWRHPARVPDQQARRNISVPVRQHADNIRTELANIGLPRIPVVALQSRRALFARASLPFRGPALTDFTSDREQYGVDYLARWSNFEALEALVSAGIAAGGADLRLTSLREGMRAVLADEAALLADFGERVRARIDELDRLVARHLEVLGYPDDDERAEFLHDEAWCGDLLTIFETARGKPYRTPALGTFARNVRMLLKPILAEPRSNSLRRLIKLERKAFDDGHDTDPEKFAEAVFDDDEIDHALSEVWSSASQFLLREIDLATAEIRHSAGTSDQARVSLEGGAGATARAFQSALRSGGMLAGTTATVLAGVALTNFWNPAGWVAGVTLAGIGAAGQLMSWIGGKAGESAESDRRSARAKAVLAGRNAIHETFDRIEQEFLTGARAASWRAAAENLRPLLRDAVVLSALLGDVQTLARKLEGDGSAIPVVSTTDVMLGAEHALAGAGSTAGEQDSNFILLGEDWFDLPSDIQPPPDPTALRNVCREQHRDDVAQLCDAVVHSLSRPEPTKLAAWLNAIADATQGDPRLREVAADYKARSSARPTVAVLGDFSAGKSSFVKRLLIETGSAGDDHPTVRADPTTAKVHRYTVGSYDLLDTPGFQSGRAGHEQEAIDGARDAAFVIVVLHVNLLLGDTSRLESLANGTNVDVGKWPRMLFLINRCDELGVDPDNEVREYFNRRERKEAELRAALQSRNIEVPGEHIHGIASDPFSSVGDRWPVTLSDYERNSDWDGMAAVVEVLQALTPEQIHQASRQAGFDAAHTRLLRIRASTEAEVIDRRAEADKHDSLIRALGICLDDADYLSRNLEQTFQQTVGRYTTAAIKRMREVETGDVKDLSEAARSWGCPELDVELKRFLTAAADEINEWSTTHSSAIGREFGAAGFDVTLDVPQPDMPTTERLRDATQAGGAVTKGARTITQALGSRDAVYAIGKSIGHKFKPWGAVKGGAAVARVGVVLGAVAVAWDGVSWWLDENNRSSWEDRCTAAIEDVESDSRERVRELLHGDGGPLALLAERRAQVAEIRAENLETQAAALRDADVLSAKRDIINELIADADGLRKEPEGD